MFQQIEVQPRPAQHRACGTGERRLGPLPETGHQRQVRFVRESLWRRPQADGPQRASGSR